MFDRVKKRTRSFNVGLPLELVDEINNITQETISVSSFVRMAVRKELKRLRGDNFG